MKIASSKITSQGQISVPLEVRRRLGVVPGSTIEWEADGDSVVVKKGGRHSFAELRRALFPKGPPEPRHLDELKKGIADYIQSKHALG